MTCNWIGFRGEVCHEGEPWAWQHSTISSWFIKVSAKTANCTQHSSRGKCVAITLHSARWRRSVIRERNLNFCLYSTLRALLLHLTDEWAASTKHLHNGRVAGSSHFVVVQSGEIVLISPLQLLVQAHHQKETCDENRWKEDAEQQNQIREHAANVAVHHNPKLPEAYTAAHRTSSAGCRRWRFRTAAASAGLSSAPPRESSRSAEIYWAGMRSGIEVVDRNSVSEMHSLEMFPESTAPPPEC